MGFSVRCSNFLESYLDFIGVPSSNELDVKVRYNCRRLIFLDYTSKNLQTAPEPKKKKKMQIFLWYSARINTSTRNESVIRRGPCANYECNSRCSCLILGSFFRSFFFSFSFQLVYLYTCVFQSSITPAVFSNVVDTRLGFTCYAAVKRFNILLDQFIIIISVWLCDCMIKIV